MFQYLRDLDLIEYFDKRLDYVSSLDLWMFIFGLIVSRR